MEKFFERENSLDILRGIFIFIMMFVDSPVDTSLIYPIFLHTEWQGISVADLAFPGFVFVMGASAAYSIARKKITLTKIFRRAIILFLLGILYNDLSAIFALFLSEGYSLQNFYEQTILHGRIFGVLQRLALVYAFGILLVNWLKSEKKIIFAAFILLIISSAGFHIYSPENPFSQEKNISLAVDLFFPGANHIYTNYCDPEGLYGTFSTTSSMLFGFVAGKFLMTKKFFQLVSFGTGIFLIALLWSFFDITSKPLWTAPYALFNAAFGILILISVKKMPQAEKIFHPLTVLGMNPIIFYFLNGLGLCFVLTLKVGDITFYTWLWQNTIYGFGGLPFSVAIFSLLWCLIWLPLAEFLYRRKIIVKL